MINAARFMNRAEIIWEKGTNRTAYFRGEVDKYTWVDVGSSFLPSELVAAFLYAQLEEADRINAKRLSLWQHYYGHLKPHADAGKLRLPAIPAQCGHNAHMFYILLHTAKQRNDVMRALNEADIKSVFHYIPLHTAPMGKCVQPNVPILPVTEDLAARLLRLPMFYDLSKEQVAQITKLVMQGSQKA